MRHVPAPEEPCYCSMKSSNALFHCCPRDKNTLLIPVFSDRHREKERENKRDTVNQSERSKTEFIWLCNRGEICSFINIKKQGNFVCVYQRKHWRKGEQGGTKTTVMVILVHPRICRLVDWVTAWIYNHGNLICGSCAGSCHVVWDSTGGGLHTRCLCWWFLL